MTGIWPWQERVIVAAMSYFGPPLTRSEYEEHCVPKVTQTTRHGGAWTRSNPPVRDVISHETLAPPSQGQNYLSEEMIFRFDGQCYDLNTLKQWIDSQEEAGLDPSVPHTRRPFTPAELQDLENWTYGRKLPDDQAQALLNLSLKVKNEFQQAVATPGGIEATPGYDEAYANLNLQLERFQEKKKALYSVQNYAIPVNITQNGIDAGTFARELTKRRTTYLQSQTHAL